MVILRCKIGPRRRTRNLVKSAVTSMARTCTTSTSTDHSSSGRAVETQALPLSHHSSRLPSLTTLPRPATQRCGQERVQLLRRKMGVLRTFAQTCRLLLPWPNSRTISPIRSPIRAVTVAMEVTHTSRPEACICNQSSNLFFKFKITIFSMAMFQISICRIF